MSQNQGSASAQTDVGVGVETEQRRAPRYRVILHNDDYTTFEFVLGVLQRIFCKTRPQAEELTMKVHKEGRAAVGVYTRDIASSLVARTQAEATKAGYPLKTTMEKD
ncbi:MAG: ATP-dependent Clp protease adaptor ClpS [Duodenibacillus sp.]|nr:ATP-dependent Clp protease adaptor ClpS [Duodenibacillus sp.]